MRSVPLLILFLQVTQRFISIKTNKNFALKRFPAISTLNRNYIYFSLLILSIKISLKTLKNTSSVKFIQKTILPHLKVLFGRRPIPVLGKAPNEANPKEETDALPLAGDDKKFTTESEHQLRR